ncbi:histone-lysine N-methyltransferase SETMAR [Trichonephila clavipes]|nr:histone-lysine N-methyltransferase SETMAR [Trichonephila clavipes]
MSVMSSTQNDQDKSHVNFHRNGLQAWNSSDYCFGLHYKKEPFLDYLVALDGKWIVYKYVVKKKHLFTKKRHHPHPKLECSRRKLCCVVGDTTRYRTLCVSERKLNGHYCSQLDVLNKEIQHKRPSLANRKEVILHQDKTRLIRGKKLNIKNCKTELETLPQLAYTPYITPPDCHLFRLLQNFLDGKEYINYEGVQMAAEELFVSKTLFEGVR